MSKIGDLCVKAGISPLCRFILAVFVLLLLMVATPVAADQDGLSDVNIDRVFEGVPPVDSGLQGAEDVSPPVAGISADHEKGEVPLEVKFEDISDCVNLTSRAWYIGSQLVDSESYFVHDFDEPGIYEVSLQVTNASGTDEASVSVHVLEKPVAEFILNPECGNAPLRVTCQGIPMPDVISWVWDFGDGASSSEQSTLHKFADPGNYTVSLTVGNGYSSDTKESDLRVYQHPVSVFSFDPTEGQAPLNVSFTDSSEGDISNWKWDFGDGANSTDQNPFHEYADVGNYTVSLNVSNPYGSDISEDIVKVLPAVLTPVSVFSFEPSEGQAPLNVSFTDESTGNVTSWKWDFGDGVNSTDQNPFHEYTVVGDYTVSLNVSNSHGSDISEDLVKVLPAVLTPVSVFSFEPTEGQAPLNVSFTDESTGNVTSWKWDFGDGTDSTEQNPEHLYNHAGNYIVSLNVSNSYGSDISEGLLKVLRIPGAPISDFTFEPEEGQVPLNVSFSDKTTGNVTSWAWDFGDGVNSAEQNPSHEYVTPGEYTVILHVSNSYGSDISEGLVKVLPVPGAPDAAFSLDPSEGNAPLNVSFTDLSTGNVTSWNWEFGDGVRSSLQNPFHEYTDAGTYTVSLNVSNAYGFDISQSSVKVLPAPVPGAPDAAFSLVPSSGNAPLSVSFSDLSTGNVTSWKWDFGDDTGSTEQNPVHKYAEAGTYTVSLSVSNEYGSDILVKESCISVRKASSGARSSGGGGTSDISASSQTDISKGDRTDFTFRKSPLYLITQTAGTDISNELITVGGCGCPSEAPFDPSDVVYRYIEVTAYHVTDESVARAHLNFRVEKDWLEKYGLLPEDIRMYRFVDGNWDILRTEMLGEDAGNYYFQATSPDYSVFAIGANRAYSIEEKPSRVIESEETPEKVTPTYEATPETPDKTPTQQTPLWWGSAFLGAGAVLLLRRRT